MLHAQNQDRLYLIAQSDEQEALIGSLAFNVQDRHWLVYCALGALHQPLAVLHIERQGAHQGGLFVAGGDQIQAILVFGVQHDKLRVGFEGRQTAVFR